jgi:D-alanyl-D-alanine carboxypeptidase (penicillin-binding protein 5/6)
MYCLTATAEKNGMRVIAVVFGAPTPKDRNAQVTKMLDYAFNQYKTHPMFERNHVMGAAKISKGDKKKVDIVTSEPISLLTKKGETVEDVKQSITIDENLKAPIKKGDQVGTLKIEKDGKTMINSPLLAKENIEKASWWQLFKRSFGIFTKTE